MNKKILIGSILVVVILILVSFTSVVGYNNVESNKILSPLFNIRSNRAIDKESKDLTCDYVGKGEEITISLPQYDKTDILQKFINLIEGMDETKINEIIFYGINMFHNINNIREGQILKIIQNIKNIREENNQPINLKNSHMETIEIKYNYFTTIPLVYCFINKLALAIIIIIIIIYCIISLFYPTCQASVTPCRTVFLNI